MNNLKSQAEKLVQEELKKCIAEKGMFVDSHHGYAVIKEELEESNDDIQECFNSLKQLWRDIKANEKMVTQLDDAHYIKTYALLLICEAVQTAAMGQKFIDSFKEGKDGRVS